MVVLKLIGTVSPVGLPTRLDVQRFLHICSIYTNAKRPTRIKTSKVDSPPGFVDWDQKHGELECAVVARPVSMGTVEGASVLSNDMGLVSKAAKATKRMIRERI
jgi:hypothetical protein